MGEAGNEDGVYVIALSEKVQSHSNHSLIKPHISSINKRDECRQFILQRSEATSPGLSREHNEPGSRLCGGRHM